MLLTVSRRGFFPVAVNGIAKTEIVVDCSAEGACANLEFDMAAAGIVSGEVVDALGEPLQNVEVQLRKKDSNLRVEPPNATSDDRGVFRIANVEPAAYTLAADPVFAGSLDELSYAGGAVDVEVGEGETVRNVRVELKKIRKFHVSGVVRGVSLSNSTGAQVEALSLEESVFWPPRKAVVDKQGRFSSSKVLEGKYMLNLQTLANRAGEGPPNRMPLRELVVDRDMADLTLSPLPPTGVRGVMKPDEGIEARPITLMASPIGGGIAHRICAVPPEYRFEMTGFLPSEYRVRAFSNLYYIHGVGTGRQNDPLYFEVAAGENRRLEIVLASDFGRVEGRLKRPRDSAQQQVQSASHYRVALSGPWGICSVQADQNGRFRFDRVIPGDYKIGVWRNLSEDEVQDESRWKARGSLVRELPVDPNSEIEVELTAAE